MNVNKMMLMAAWLLMALSCKKAGSIGAETAIMAQESPTEMRAGVVTTETFETGTKASYAAANVTLGTGVWNLNDALIGNTTADIKAGAQSARVRNSGKLTMQFNRTTGAGTVTVQHAKYGTDGNGTWSLWYSTNSGTSYTQVGASVTTSTTTLATATFTVNVAGTVRLEIRKTDGGTNRINFDTSRKFPIISKVDMGGSHGNENFSIFHNDGADHLLFANLAHRDGVYACSSDLPIGRIRFTSECPFARGTYPLEKGEQWTDENLIKNRTKFCAPK